MSAPAASMFTPGAKAMAEKLGLKMGRANLEEFAATLEELAQANPNIVAVTSDSRGSGKLAPFGKALPKQIVEVGIAEQNLVGITAGLAACGKKSFGVSPACFHTLHDVLWRFVRSNSSFCLFFGVEVNCAHSSPMFWRIV